MKITEKILLDCGFNKEIDVDGWEEFNYEDVIIWDSGHDYWVINMLDQAGIDIEYKTMEELNVFFSAINKPLGYTQ